MNKITTLLLLALCCFNLSAEEQTVQDNFLVTDDGTELFVKKSGQGPVCIFIHGGPGAWSQSFEQLKGNRLEDQLTMIYYDQRGSGRSAKSKSGDYSLDRMVKDIELIRQHYHASDIYLMSHSFGGILAVNYAQHFPEHIKGLILANSTLNLTYSLNNQIDYVNQLLGTDFKPSDNRPDSVMSTFMQARKALSDKGLSYKVLSGQQSSVELVNAIDEKSPSDYDFSKHAFQIDDYWQDYTTITAQIEVPTLVISGMQDHSVGEQHYQSFHFSHMQIKQIDGGHLLYYENSDPFIQSVFEFVQRTK
ncbi:alpha/beta fold hydrolase [Neptunicella sp. SCSIO 80796]|uniref:alpha/beta fold hydrolase n=1 Tax=Neptunicella plasticusilytica TaxID=3117012 RepID=UPI003A4E654B